MYYLDENKVATDKEISNIALSGAFKAEMGTFKISILGMKDVGKATFSTSYLDPVFRDTEMTLGCELFSKFISIMGLKLKLQCWMIPIGGRFRFLYPKYILGSTIIAFMYDISSLNTLISLKEYIQSIHKNHPNIPIFLIGNKLDLEENRDVPKENVLRLIRENNIVANYEISAKNGEKVEGLFKLIVKVILKDFGFNRCESSKTNLVDTFTELRMKEKSKKRKKKDKNR